MPNEHFYPDDCRGAVSLTFDDGGPSQLERAIPLMEERGLRGTFYVSVKVDDYVKRLEPWGAVAEKGHEIGNHTKSHTCSRNFSDGPDAKGLERSTLEEIEVDLLAAEAILRERFPDITERSFAYPCYMTHVGAGLTRQSYVPIVAKHFVAGRATGEYAFFNSPVNQDLHCLNCQPVERMPGAEMMGLVELAVRRGHWLIFAFHSIDGGRLGASEFDFKLLVDHLAEHRDRIWTAPVVEVAKRIIEVRRERGLG